jgi:transposase-like protein
MRILRQARSDQSIAAVCGEYEIPEHTLYRWHRKYGKMDLSDAKRLNVLQQQNRRIGSSSCKHAPFEAYIESSSCRRRWPRTSSNSTIERVISAMPTVAT